MRLLAAVIACRICCAGVAVRVSQFCANYFDRGLGGFLAGRVAAQAVHHQENAEGVIDVAAILILGAHAAGIGDVRRIAI